MEQILDTSTLSIAQQLELEWQAMDAALMAKIKTHRSGVVHETDNHHLGDQVALKGREPYGAPNVADVYSVTPGEVPSGAIGESGIRWYAPLPKRILIIPSILADGPAEVVVVNDVPHVNRIAAISEPFNG